MSKQDIRNQLADDLVAFAQLGGTITLLKSKKVRAKNTAACRHRRGVASKSEGFYGEEPTPVHSWCQWSGDRLLNVAYKTGRGGLSRGLSV
jgi:hypothetical protein